MTALEERITQLKTIIRANAGANVADAAFAAEVDDLISAFYDDIGEIKAVRLGSLFDLFVIKTLYVQRGSRDSNVIEYLSGMMASFLFTRDLFPLVREGRRYAFLLSDLLEELQQMTHFQNLFEAYRKLGDYSLFVTGLFPASLRRRRRFGRWAPAREVPRVDVKHHVTNGKRYYLWAAEHELAEATQQRSTLSKLSRYFELYMDALNEMSDKYILGFDMNLIADKMLDSFNRYRATGDATYLENARKYAAILRVDRASFPSLFRMRRRQRARIL